MSSSSASEALSIVIGSNGAPGSVERCLEALEPQLDGAEVLVCEPVASSEDVQRRFGFARFLEGPGALVPKLWRDGLDASGGELVALTISLMRPASNWVATVRHLLESDEVVAGAIDPGEGLRLVDWAEYFCRYASDMRPFARGENAEIPGDNCAYRRALLERTHELWRDGFWEPEVNRALRLEGVHLWHDPTLVVMQGRSAGFSRFLGQRFVHGREYGRLRGRRFSAARNLAGVPLAVAVPFVLALRTAKEVFARRRYRGRFLLSVPALLAYDAAWAAGEAVGHVQTLRGP
jgi:hypothetical protein